MFFEGQFDAAIKEMDAALRLTEGNYPNAEHDKRLVEAVKKGRFNSIPKMLPPTTAWVTCSLRRNKYRYIARRDVRASSLRSATV